MLRVLRLFNQCATAQPSQGFQAVSNREVKKTVLGYANPKLNALVEVLHSLNNR